MLNQLKPEQVTWIKAAVFVLCLVPLALLMMGFLEVTRFSIYVLHALGLTLLFARLIHGAALSFGWQQRSGRIAGATLTFIVVFVEAVLCVYQGLRGHSLWFQ